jgi:outer membrane protein assembly factor BamB
LRWRHSHVPDEERATPSTRGLAVDNGRVFRGTSDGRLLALDASTGRELWKSVIAAPRLGESTAAAPLAWAGVVYMGIAGSDLGARGRVMAFDQQTGRELWRFHTIPMGNETGAETWERPGTAKTGGGGIWGAMTLDVATGELFVPVGNPWPDIDRAYRPGKNLFTNAVVVLDARSGALRWWYQATPEDWVDLDLAAPPVLYRARGARDLMVFGGKDGHVWGVDRDTHERVFRTPVTEQAFAKNHLGNDIAMSIYNDSAEITLGGVVAVEATGIVPDLAAAVTLANGTQSAKLFTTPVSNAGFIVTGANLTRANTEFETGEVSGLYKPLFPSNAPAIARGSSSSGTPATCLKPTSTQIIGTQLAR